jgi:hypothetical protein
MGMRKLTKYIFIILSTIGIAGCSDYLDVNDNPNEPTTVPLSSLMATASFATGENIQAIGGITSYYVQYLASPNPSGSTDIQEPVAYDNAWFLLYHTLGDIADMEKQAIESGASHYTGAAKLLKAIHLQLIVDAWGDVPYTEALFAETVTPAYDEDSDLYPVILALISDGIAELSKAESTYELGAQDFIYGDRPDEAAQVSAWIKMGYALKARTLLHMSKTPGYDPEEVLAAVDNAFTSNADNADIVYFGWMDFRTTCASHGWHQLWCDRSTHGFYVWRYR